MCLVDGYDLNIHAKYVDQVSFQHVKLGGIQHTSRHAARLGPASLHDLLSSR